MCTLATTVLTIFIVFSFLQAAALAFRFELKTGMTKCFSEEIAKDALAVGKYTIPAGGDVVDAGVPVIRSHTADC